ncbi:unnamed protein product [Blepharisma stoltei]|uniref:Transmembrane protein n=1 Tax=Blepharisma stoltei TaxID=1481888 RepID=A0AAU9K0Q6_9CILI|nr:unnamed protein product [Blepharisma stoltei]
MNFTLNAFTMIAIMLSCALAAPLIQYKFQTNFKWGDINSWFILIPFCLQLLGSFLQETSIRCKWKNLLVASIIIYAIGSLAIIYLSLFGLSIYSLDICKDINSLCFQPAHIQCNLTNITTYFPILYLIALNVLISATVLAIQHSIALIPKINSPELVASIYIENPTHNVEDNNSINEDDIAKKQELSDSEVSLEKKVFNRDGQVTTFIDSFEEAKEAGEIFDEDKEIYIKDKLAMEKRKKKSNRGKVNVIDE